MQEGGAYEMVHKCLVPVSCVRSKTYSWTVSTRVYPAAWANLRAWYVLPWPDNVHVPQDPSKQTLAKASFSHQLKPELHTLQGR